MNRILLALVLCLPLMGQLTPDQKWIDFLTVASLYAKQYAPYEWKRDNFQFDLMDLRPWQARVRESKSDLEYLEIVAEYIARLNDAHSYYVVNSDFAADLHITTDIYDGKVLIEGIDRDYLPVSRYDFAVGDEVVLIDGRPVAEVIREVARINPFANERATSRWAADLLVFRPQAYLPRAVELGRSATLLIRRADGAEKSYQIDWDKTGTPVTKVGVLPNFQLQGRLNDELIEGFEPEVPSESKEYLKPWMRLRNLKARRTIRALRGYGAVAPVYQMPSGFQRRLGGSRNDYFYSGTYVQDGKRVGYIRIPNFDPVSQFGALTQFDREIAFFKANTDSLVVDVTRNPGGDACYVEDLLRYTTAREFQTYGVEIRPSLSLLQEWRAGTEFALQFATPTEAQQYLAILHDIESAFSENRGRTGPTPLCNLSLQLSPQRDRTGNLLAYDKPVLVLTDEFTTSAGDIFAAVMQDSGAKLFGYRTTGAGGNTVAIGAGFFSEGVANVTQMLLVRPETRAVAGFPATRYIENVGVHPDFPYDYQTRENLINGGRAFPEAFFAAAAALAGN